MNLPYDYDYMNVVTSVLNPTGVTVSNTKISAYYRRYLLQKAMSIFKWKLPESWSESYFLYSLYCRGSVAILETDKFGVICQSGVPSGYNVFYQPKYYTISNPLLQGVKQPIIDEQCTVFKLTADWGGIMDLVGFYADYMALTAKAIGTNILNTKMSYVFGADSDSIAKSFKKAIDQIESGQPAVVVDKKLFKENGEFATPFFQQNLKQTYVAQDLLETMRTLENMFCREIGLPNMNFEKRERMSELEVTQNNASTYTTAEMWFDSWQDSIKKTRDMFGIDISVEWREQNENSNNVGVGSLSVRSDDI